MPLTHITTEKMAHTGQAIGRIEGKVFFVWNALPDETLNVLITKNKKDFGEASAQEIIHASPFRVSASEKHFLSCSPWQIMKPEYEEQCKREITRETFEKIGKIDLPALKVVSADAEFGYRNKMEYSFWEEDGKFSLAFYERGGRMRYAIDECVLALPAINMLAHEILNFLNTLHLPRAVPKSLVIRANQAGESKAALLVRDKNFAHALPENLEKKLAVYYSNEKSPASVVTSVIREPDDFFLSDTLSGKTFSYGIMSFFQINIPVFEAAFARMKTHVKNSDELLDLYAGVGSIGISLASEETKLTCVEIDAAASAFTEQNIRKNQLQNAKSICFPSEQLLDTIQADQTVIVDPPRAGLDLKLTEKLLGVLPKTIFYLSCNIATQARDIALLKEKYSVISAEVYNFFPKTPHIECLLILEKK